MESATVMLRDLFTEIAKTPLFEWTLRPEWSHLGIELIVYVIFWLCLRHARRTGAIDAGGPRRGAPSQEWVAAMIAAIGLTLVIEILLSHQLVPSDGGQVRLYEYPPGSFLIQIVGVPIWVPIGWSFILYVTMRTTTLLGVPWYVAPLLDGFLALNLDLTLDPIAVHRGWWDWLPGRPGTGVDPNSYFGIPLVNFMGWFVIVASFSFFIRFFFRWRRQRGRTPAPGVLGNLMPAAVAAGAAFLVVLLYQFAVAPRLTPVTTTLAWLAAAIIVVANMRRFYFDSPLERLFLAVPVVFHSYSILLLFFTKAQSPPSQGTGWLMIEEPELAIFMPVAALLGLWLYVWPYLGTLALRRPASAGPT